MHRRRERADRHRQAAVPLRSRRLGADREQGGGGRVECEVGRVDDLGYDAGADSDSQRACAHARAARVAGERHRAVRRRRVRSQDHDVLSGRAAAAVGGDAAEPAAQVDRGSPGEFLRDDAGAGTGARRRDGAHEGWAHPRRARRVPVRHGCLRSLRSDDSHQQPVHAARAVRHRRTTKASSRLSSRTRRSSRRFAAPAVSTACS